MSRIRINILNNLDSLALSIILVNLFLLFRNFSSNTLPYPWFSGSVFFRSIDSNSIPLRGLTTVFSIYNFPYG